MNINKKIITTIIESLDDLTEYSLPGLMVDLSEYHKSFSGVVNSKDLENIDTNELLSLLALVHEVQSQMNRIRGQFIGHQDVNCMHSIRAIEVPKEKGESSSVVSFMDFNKTEE